MENATKALIIAGSLLIAVLLITLGVFLFNMYSNYTNEVDQKQADQQIVQYNMQYEKYMDKTLTIHDVYTIVNLANEYSANNANDSIKVICSGIYQNLSKKDWVSELEKHEDDRYEIKSITKKSNGIIDTITITKK